MSFLNKFLGAEERPAFGLRDETKRELAQLRKMASFAYAVKKIVPREFLGFEYDEQSSNDSAGVQVFRRAQGEILHCFILFRTNKFGGGFSIELAVSLLPYFPYHDFGSLGARFGRRIRLGRLFAGCDYWWQWGREIERMPGLLADSLIKLHAYAPRFFNKAGDKLLGDGQSVQLARAAGRWVADWRRLESSPGAPPEDDAEGEIERTLASYPIYSDLHPAQRRFYRFVMRNVLSSSKSPSSAQLDAAFHFAGLLMVTEGI